MKKSLEMNMTVKKFVLLLLILCSVTAGVFAWGPEPQHYIGREYYICDEPINVRDKGGLAGNKIDRLRIGERVKILDYGKSEAIDGTYGYYWTKIEFHGGKTGWVYGKYIATATVVCDFDKNGADDYIFFRQKNEAMFYTFTYPDDIIVYMNGKKIPSPDLSKSNFSHAYFYKSGDNDKVLISMENIYDGSPLPGEDASSGIYENQIYIFLVDKSGIKFKDKITDSNCEKTDSDGHTYGELYSNYIEPHLGKNYEFIRSFD